MKICYFGIYNYKFSRNKVYMTGLRELGVEIVECQDNSKSVLKFWRLWKKYGALKKDFDAIIVGYPGHVVVPLARILSVVFKPPTLVTHELRRSRRVPVIADLLGSLYDAEFHSHTPNQLKRIKAKIIDYLAVKFADKILLESEEQKKYFEHIFGKSDKYKVVYTGVDEGVYSSKIVTKSPVGASGQIPNSMPAHAGEFQIPNSSDQTRERLFPLENPAEQKLSSKINDYIREDKKNAFTVLFRGKLTPECGIGYILSAAELLKENFNIKFRIIGRGYLLDTVEKTIKEKQLDNVELISHYLTDQEMKQAIQGASIYLGQFEDNHRLKRTIPHKAFEAFVSGAPYLTEDTQAIRELVTDGVTGFLIPMTDPKMIADKILELSNNRSLLKQVSVNAKKMYEEKLTPKKLGQSILDIL